MTKKTSIKKNQGREIQPSVAPQIGISLLQKLIEKAKELQEQPHLLQSSDIEPWAITAQDYLVRAFGSESQNVGSVLHAEGDGGIYRNMSEREWEKYLRSGLKNKVKILESCIGLLETEIEISSKEDQIIEAPAKSGSPVTNRVFIVHGHDHGLKESVARFIEKIDLEPVILHEKPNAGRTIIEKFSDYSDVHFAIVLLTADDEGRLSGSSEEMKPRARQNVILELGYFLGKLGRQHVCALYEKGVEIPSDYDGVLFIPLGSNDRWKSDLVRELKAAGFHVDANLIYGAG